MATGELKRLTLRTERIKAEIGIRVEHPFHVVKNPLRHRKVSQKGLAKNGTNLHNRFALDNLVIVEAALMA